MAPEEPTHAPTMDPDIWGGALWDVLFTIAFKCRPERRADAQTLLADLESVLPCATCRQHYVTTLRRKPLGVADEKDIGLWLYAVRSRVNRRLGRPSPSFDVIRRRFAAFTCPVADTTAAELCVLLVAGSASQSTAWRTVRLMMSLLGEVAPHLHTPRACAIQRSDAPMVSVKAVCDHVYETLALPPLTDDSFMELIGRAIETNVVAVLHARAEQAASRPRTHAQRQQDIPGGQRAAPAGHRKSRAWMRQLQQ